MRLRSTISDNRTKNVAIFIIILFAILIGRLFFLQIISFAYYNQISQENSVRMVPVAAPRGFIRDRHSKLLATNRALYTISYLPYIGGSFEKTGYLAELIGVDEQKITKILNKPISSRYKPVKLIRDVDFETICKIEENVEKLPGIIYQTEVTRKYPDKNYGSHLFGYVGEISENELKNRDPNIYNTGDIIGIGGLEERYDRILRGREGIEYLEVAASGKVLGVSPIKESLPPQIGSEIILNIDWDVQCAAESILSNYLGGAAVAIDPQDGAVLAFVSQPNYDVNAFAGVISNELWASVSSDSTHPLLNRACVGTYPPGSIFKVITAGAALEVDSVSVNDTFKPCYGAIRFGNRDFKCWKPAGHGRQNMLGAMIHSCDVYFYQLGELIGLDVWEEYCDQNGFGRKMGLDSPNESAGISPSREYFNRKYGKGKWSRTLIVNLSIGQGEILVTPLQMACYYAALANGGSLYKPRLVNRIVSVSGEVFSTERQQIKELPFSASTISFLVKSLTAVVADSEGTGIPARIPGITIAGKTGTAQNPHGLEHAWFCCFAPVEDPKIAIACIVENAGHGSTHAAPLAREMIKAYLLKDDKSITEESTEDEINIVN
ncbi:MAG: penicillin-binding protein 2 [candidate division Zixibacteria bacterium]|nr:penicillin-binding protein 2 [candidate division Zixibacteria bacterium]